MNSKERSHLRGEAQRLSPLVHIGHGGITDAIVQTMDDVLRTHELVKVDISRNLAAPIKEVANSLAEATGAAVVQVIGRKATLFRDNPDLDWKGSLPPWR